MSQSGSLFKTIVEWAFLVLVFSLAFMRPSLVVVGSTATITDFVFLGCAGLFVVAVVARQVSFRLDRIYIWLGIYALVLLLAAAFSIDAARSLGRLPAELYLIALAILTFNVVVDDRMLKRTLVVWLVAAIIAALVPAIAAFSFYIGWDNPLATFAMHHYGTLPPGNYPRIQGTFEYPAMLCNYLTVGLMVLLAFWHLGRIRTTLFALLVGLFAIAIFFTLTPGIGGVIAAVGLWAYFIARAKGSRPAAIVAIVFVIGSMVALVVVSSLTPFGTTGPIYFSVAGYDITPTARLLAWQQALGTIAAHPLLGVGVGLPVVDLPYQVPSGGWSLVTDAHNVALNVAAQMGIVGLTAIVGLAVAVVRRTRFDLSGLDAIATLRLALGVAFVSCFVIQGLVGSFENARHLWVLIGLIVAADRIRQSQPQTTEPHA